jgi:5-methylcytosine-specific restriction endonuclease McrA
MAMASKDKRRRRRSLVLEQEGRCRDCGGDIRHSQSQIHHLVPVAEGGSNALTNLVLLCPRCHWNRHHPLRAVDAHLPSVGGGGSATSAHHQHSLPPRVGVVL